MSKKQRRLRKIYQLSLLQTLIKLVIAVHTRLPANPGHTARDLTPEDQGRVVGVTSEDVHRREVDTVVEVADAGEDQVFCVKCAVIIRG